MFLYLDENNNRLHLVSNVRVLETGLKEICVKDDFVYQKEVLQDSNKFYIDLTAKEILEKVDYQNLRYSEYPPFNEQLDMIYKDMQNNTKNWCELITSIKVKYPKSDGV